MSGQYENGLRLLYGDKSAQMPNGFKSIDTSRKVLLVAGEDASVAFIVGTDKEGSLVIEKTDYPSQILCYFHAGSATARPCQSFSEFEKSAFIDKFNFDLRGRLLVLHAIESMDSEMTKRLRDFGIQFDLQKMHDFYWNLIQWHNQNTFRNGISQNEIASEMHSAGIGTVLRQGKQLDRAIGIYKYEIAANLGGLPIPMFAGGQCIAQIGSGKVALLELCKKKVALNSKNQTVLRKSDSPKMIRIVNSVVGNFSVGKEYEVLEWIDRMGKRYARVVDDSGLETRISEERIGWRCGIPQ